MMKTLANTTLGSSENTTTTDDGGFMFEDYTQRVLLAVILGVVTVVGLVGNSLVILAVVLSRKLRSSTNWFVVNLACADVILCLMIPFNMIGILSEGGWPLPGWICAVTSAVSLVSLGTSVMTLAFIAYNRWYLLTQQRGRFQKLYRIRNIFIMIVVSWSYPFFLVVIPHFAGLGRLGYSERYRTCSQDTSLPTSNYYSLLAGVALIIPVFVAIVTIYLRIYRFVSRQSKKMSSAGRSTGPSAVAKRPQKAVSTEMSSTELTSGEPSTLTVETSVEDVGTTFPHLSHSEKSLQTPVRDDVKFNSSASEAQENSAASDDKTASSITRAPPRQLNRYNVTVTKRLFIVVLAFFICLLPFGVSVVVPPSDPGIPWTGTLLTFNSCVNPIIYARTMPVFRKVMWCIIRCNFSSIPEPLGFIRRRN